MNDLREQAGGSGIHNNTWYRNTEEEAKAAKLVYAQNEIWEKVEGRFRQSKKVDQLPVEGELGRPESMTAMAEGGRSSESERAGKEKKVTEEGFGRTSKRIRGIKPHSGGGIHTTGDLQNWRPEESRVLAKSGLAPLLISRIRQRGGPQLLLSLNLLDLRGRRAG